MILKTDIMMLRLPKTQPFSIPRLPGWRVTGSLVNIRADVVRQPNVTSDLRNPPINKQFNTCDTVIGCKEGVILATNVSGANVYTYLGSLEECQGTIAEVSTLDKNPDKINMQRC